MTELYLQPHSSLSPVLGSMISPFKQISSVFRRTIAATLVTLLAFNQSIVVLAQPAAEFDIDPPVIDHESLETGIAGQMQLFSALVVDDQGIEYVNFYHRSKTNSDYRQVPMSAVAGTANFAASIETELGQSKIEYYIEAADTGGNRVLKGFPFFPLVRNLDIAPRPAVTVSSQPDQNTDNGSSRWLYVALGALAVGLLASTSSSGGGDTTPEEPGEQVPLTINISSPLN